MDIECITGVTDDEDLQAGPAIYPVEQARRIVERFARVTTSRDLDAFVSGFVPDCVVHFPPAPEARGHDGLRILMTPFMSSNRKDFVCRKRLRALSGRVFGVVWVNTWVDGATGKARQAKGLEFWTMRGEQIVRWDATSATWER